MTAGAIILAGGASRRMGTPKALLSFTGETFLDRLTGIFEPHCSQIVVVLGYGADQIRNSLIRQPEFVTNPEPERGQLTSLQCGLRAIRPGLDAVFFTPVDFPAVRAGTVAALLQSKTGRDLIAVPRHQGKHGHPVLITIELVPEFLALSAEQSARDVMHRHLEQTRYVDVDDPGILLDVDDPAAYSELVQANL